MKETKTFIPIYFDVLFKKIFGDPKDLKPLKYLLKTCLNIEPKEITILSPEVLGQKYKTKRTYLDLLVKLEDGTKISIEVNTNPESYVIDRNLFYLFKVMGNDLKIEDEYTNLHKHIQLNFNVYINQKNPVLDYKLVDINTKEILTDKLEIINIDVTYFANTWYNKGDEFSKLMGLIGTKDVETMKHFEHEEGIVKDIMEKADKFRDDSELVQVYDYEKMRDSREIAAKKLGREEGFQDGINYNINHTAKLMLEKNIDIKVIKEITGLTEEQIKNLE